MNWCGMGWNRIAKKTTIPLPKHEGVAKAIWAKNFANLCPITSRPLAGERRE